MGVWSLEEKNSFIFLKNGSFSKQETNGMGLY